MKTLQEIADTVGGRLIGDGTVIISRIAGIAEASEGDVAFLAQPAFAKYLKDCRASALIAGEEWAALSEGPVNKIIVTNPALAYIDVAELFDTSKHKGAGIHESACVSPDARIARDAAICAFVHVGKNSVIGRGATVYPFAHIGDNVFIGEDTVIYPNVTIYDGVRIGRRVIIHAGAVLGSDGFGYTWDGTKHRKIPQLGTLVIEDEVEVGANTAIDRGSLGQTSVGRGVKIDNLVQIAHNVSIGDHSIIVALVGIAGSSTLGRNVVLAGRVGVRDHVTIGDNVRAGGGTGITKDVPGNSTIMGTPHMPHREWLKLQTYIKKLPDLFRRMTQIEKDLNTEKKHDRD
jgi:UDP-3-O-[3-hydroxymyristoyl] glucosamine N-acyltransferase